MGRRTVRIAAALPDAVGGGHAIHRRADRESSWCDCQRPGTTTTERSAAASRERVTAELRRAGCVAAEREAAELLAAAGTDTARLAKLVERRSTGEPLAWLTGSVRFCGETVRVAPGVYVPRPQSEPLARAAVARLP